MLPSILSRLLAAGLAARYSEVCLSRLLYPLLVWASVRVLEAGRVEQDSNGGYWAHGVCRGQSSRRKAPGVCEASPSKAPKNCVLKNGEEKKEVKQQRKKGKKEMESKMD
jgi:hypothetical protein